MLLLKIKILRFGANIRNRSTNLIRAKLFCTAKKSKLTIASFYQSDLKFGVLDVKTFIAIRLFINQYLLATGKVSKIETQQKQEFLMQRIESVTLS